MCTYVVEVIYGIGDIKRAQKENNIVYKFKMMLEVNDDVSKRTIDALILTL